MNKLYLFTLFFLVHIYSFAQDKDNSVYTFEINNLTLRNSFQKIENEAECKFYFNELWLEDYKELTINEKFESKSIIEILTVIFQNTNLNFYKDGKRIILTKNSLIYEIEELPKSTISQEKKDEIEPPLIIQNLKNNKSKSIIYIGKEQKNNLQKQFTLSGIIKDEKTGEPISNIVVRLKNSSRHSVSNETGYYSIVLPAGLNELETSSVNYLENSYSLVLYNNGKLNIELIEKINQLKEVVLTGKHKEVINSATTGVTSINSEDIKSVPMVLGERDILKVATVIPGIKTAGEGSAGFNVRGGKDDQNLFLLDDVVLYNPAHFFGFFSSVNAYTVKNADIYKGSIPSKFGGRLSSVFDISIKDGNSTKFNGEGGIGPVTSNLTANIPVIKEKSSILVGARATYSDWILKSLKEKSLKNSNASFYDAILKYNHKINSTNDIETLIYYSDDKFSVSSDSLYGYNNNLMSIKWKSKFNDNHKLTVNLANSFYNFKINYDNGLLNSFDYGYKLNDTQFSTKFIYSKNDKHLFDYGFSTKLYNLSPGYISPVYENSLISNLTLEKERGLESAVHFSDSYKINDLITINAGFRFSHFAALGTNSTQNLYENGMPKNEGTLVEVKEFKSNEVIKTFSGFEPRFSLRYLITNDFSFKASIDKTYQYLHLLSSNTTQSPLDIWKLSDLNVNPQSSIQYSLGLYKNFKENMYQVSIEGYRKKINNVLDYKVGAQLVLNENVETELLQGEGKAYGLEFLLKKQEGRLNGWLGYTYSRTFYKLASSFSEETVNNGEFFAANFDKPHDFSVILNYKFTRRYSFSTNFIYQTGRPITYPIGSYEYGGAQYTLYSDRNKFRIPDYYRLDIGMNIEGNHKIKKLAHSFWNISIYNVLGRNNPYSIFFVTNNSKIKAFKTSIFTIPIPTITYNFKF